MFDCTQCSRFRSTSPKVSNGVTKDRSTDDFNTLTLALNRQVNALIQAVSLLRKYTAQTFQMQINNLLEVMCPPGVC